MPTTKKLSVPEQTIPVAILLLAAVLRFALLGMKPPHFDEGVNGFFVDQITRTGLFRYDPSNFHGPLHMYLLFLFQTLFGRHIWALRLPDVMIGTASVWLVMCFDRFLDRRTCRFAALAMALSPAMVFYARYAIHESELVFFLLLSVWGAAGMWVFGEKKHLWATGIGLTGMLLTKETYVIHVVCFALAAGCVVILEKLAPMPFPPRAKQSWNLNDLGGVIAVSLFAILFFYSGGLLDPTALNGLWQTYASWFHKGTDGEGHDKNWWYWLLLLARYELPALIGLVATIRFALPRQNRGLLYASGAITAGLFTFILIKCEVDGEHSLLIKVLLSFVFAIALGGLLSPPAPNRLLRLLAIYGTGTFVAYSIVRYKTPWCIISLIWPFYFVLGSLISDLITRYGKTAINAFAACMLLSGSLAVRLNFFHCTDEQEPYVYVQTYEDIELKLVKPLSEMVAHDPRNYQVSGSIIVSSYHPLVWLLADYPNVIFYDDNQSPDDFDADFLLVENERIEDIEKKLKGSYFAEVLKLRDGMDPTKLYLSYGKFNRMFPGRPPDFSPNGAPASTKSAIP